MGALAFQEQVENLAAVTRSRSLDVPRTAEVLTLERVSIVRKITRMTERAWRLRSLYIILARDVPTKAAVTTLSEGGMDFSGSIAAIKQLLKNTEAPTLTDEYGDDAVDALYGLAAQYARKSADDGRYIRRHANKLREAGDACDIQRVKVYAKAKELLEFVEAVEQGGVRVALDDKYKYDDIFDAHLSNYSVTMDYLAR